MTNKTDLRQLAKVTRDFKRMSESIDSSGITLEQLFSGCKVMKRSPIVTEKFQIWLATFEVFGSSQTTSSDNPK